MDYIHFLDNNIFRALCKPSNGHAFKNLCGSINNFSFLEGKHDIPFKLTPFSILEAIGLKPPQMYQVCLPSEIIQAQDPTDIVIFLSLKAKEFYRESKNISLEKIHLYATKQEKYVNDEAKTLYYDLVINRIDEEGFIDYLQNQLIMDYLLKYDYQEIDDIMLGFFGS